MNRETEMWAVVSDDGEILCVDLSEDTAKIRRYELPFGTYYKHTVRRVTVTLDPTETESVNNNAQGASGVEEEKLWN